MATERTIDEKADMVAEATISANQKLATTPGADRLKHALSTKLAESHRGGRIDLDKFMEPERTQERASRDDGRSR
ncbi:MAG: hypothetical protein ACK5HY_01275 [Parahaliea sp.]